MDLDWEEVFSVDGSNIPKENFWNGVKVWIQRPHILNKRLIGVDIVKTIEISATDCLTLYNQCIHSNAQDAFRNFQNLTEPFAHRRSDKVIQLRRLLPKLGRLEIGTELLIIDKHDNSVEFILLPKPTEISLSPKFPYKISYNKNRITFQVAELGKETSIAQNQATFNWMKNEVFPKIIKWCTFVPTTKRIIPSLSQVSMKAYYQNYIYMKLKYGRKLVENWPEGTDPQKFVYEDIAIAAYLMSLWEVERKNSNFTKKQSFVDLGCGNGLLVYLLTSEGHEGIGVDVKRRKIWDFYGKNTQLIEQAIIPSDSGLFPDYDWIIGNHSDELTPWIPVIAARSSYSMKVFLLPCCPYTFDGKHERKSSNMSKYQSYIDFIQELCNHMGFYTQLDKLRIPSCKNICLICTSRNYDLSSEDAVDRLRIEFIEKHSKKNKKAMLSSSNVDDCSLLTDSGIWSSSFEPRIKEEIIRNCCNMEPSFITKSVIQIMSLLLHIDKRAIQLCIDDKKVTWRCGGNMAIKELAEALDHGTLQELKNQNGGLQTLMKNHRNIFNVEKGCVSLRIPSLNETMGQMKRIKDRNDKKKTCFFHFYHPDGCPLTCKSY